MWLKLHTNTNFDLKLHVVAWRWWLERRVADLIEAGCEWLPSPRTGDVMPLGLNGKNCWYQLRRPTGHWIVVSWNQSMKGVAKRMAAPSFYEFTTSGEWRRGRRLLLLRCPFRSLHVGFTWQHQGKIWTNYELTYEKRKTWVRQASHVEGIKGLEVINPFRDRVKVWGSTQSASGLVTCQPNRPQEVWSSGGTLKERRP